LRVANLLSSRMLRRVLPLIATMIIPTILGVIQIYDWLERTGPDVIVYVDAPGRRNSHPIDDRDCQLRVVNRGSSLAREITITLAQEAQYHIRDEGTGSEQEADNKKKSQIRIPLLAPDEVKFVGVWSYDGLPATPVVRATSDGGRIPVVQGTVIRTGYNYVIELSHGTFLVIVASAFVLGGITLIIVLAKRKRSPRRYSVGERK
jgi:hypothetical protein